MSDPIIERIRQNLMDTLATVNTSNGYTYDLVFEEVSKNNQPDHLKVVVHERDPKEMPLQTFDKQWIEQPFYCELFIMPPDGDPVGIDTYANAITADIRKALVADTGTPPVYTRGGLAFDTKVGEWQYGKSANGQLDVPILPILVQFRTKYTDPTSL